MSLSPQDEVPAWGQLPAEQYLIRHWDPASPESPDQQRTHLIKDFLNLDQIPEELDPTWLGNRPWEQSLQTRTPTEEEIATILQPWRSDRLRITAWKLWKQGADDDQPVLLRTYYNADDDDRVKGWATLSEYYQEVSHWAVLDDPELFDFEGQGVEWQQVFHILPELSKIGERYSRRINSQWIGPFLTDFKDGLDTVKQQLPTWRRNFDLLVTENPATGSLLYFVSTTQVLIADKETFETDKLLLVFLDAKQNITMQGRIEITEERFDQLSIDWGLRKHPDDVCDEGTIGEGYLVNGEAGKQLYQWTEQDLQGDPVSDVARP
ncbi:hypothetical protein BDW75DRAFT_22212 [Aspergillus navahoensis]